MTDQELRLAILDRALAVALDPNVNYTENVDDFILDVAAKFEKFVVGKPEQTCDSSSR